MEKWKVFTTPDGREVGAYTIRGEFEGEEEATRQLTAYENDLEPEQIKVAVVTR